MTRRAVALFSGGLDSMLAIRILQEQGFEVEALNIRTVFDCCKTPAAQAALNLGVRMTVLSVADDYIDLIRNPAHGHGKGINPCVDCRIYMSRMAGRFMKEVDACVVITGEILGQRPMSQKRQDLDVIERKSDLEGRLLRPLSAKSLPPTIPEREGLIDREKLFDFSGRNRTPLIELAHRLGIGDIPQPSTGCALTEVTFAPRVVDLMEHQPDASRWDFEILNVGRHLRHDDATKIVIGRNAEENAMLGGLFEQHRTDQTAYLEPENFRGPDAMIIGPISDPAIRYAAALVLRYSRYTEMENAQVTFRHGDQSRLLRAEPMAAAADASLL